MSLFKEATFVTVRKKEVERIRDRIDTLGLREKAYCDSDRRDYLLSRETVDIYYLYFT